VPRPAVVPAEERAARIRALWNRSFLLTRPTLPRGVTRFRDIEAAGEARYRATMQRMKATAQKP